MEFSEGASMDDLDYKKKRQKYDSKPEWADLPQEILGLFLEKLHLAGRIRFRSVCKNWCLPKDQLLIVKSSGYMPWLLSFPLDGLSQKLQILDPHAQELNFPDCWPKNHPMSRPPDYHCYNEVFACKHGWLLRGKWSNKLFLQNPFKNEVSLLPSPDNMSHLAATFTRNSKSTGCEIVVFSRCPRSFLYINRYRLSSSSTDPNWEMLHIGTMAHQDAHYSIHYMEGMIYYFMAKDDTRGRGYIILKYCHLDGKFWSSESGLILPEQVRCSERRRRKYWLTDIHKNLTLVVRVYKDGSLKFMVFSYDRSRTCWAELTDLDGIAFFISDRSILSAPSNHLGCRVFYAADNGEVYYYSLKEDKHEKADDLYSPKEWKEDKMKYGRQEFKRCFIEPAPYFRKSKSKF